jgi:hypothetical protein
MTTEHSLRDRLHDATHRIPGVPAHVEQPAGHQGGTGHGRDGEHGGGHQGTARQGSAHAERASASPAPENATRATRDRSRNHSPSRPPRVFAEWQRRVGRFFGQDV